MNIFVRQSRNTIRLECLTRSQFFRASSPQIRSFKSQNSNQQQIESSSSSTISDTPPPPVIPKQPTKAEPKSKDSITNTAQLPKDVVEEKKSKPTSSLSSQVSSRTTRLSRKERKQEKDLRKTRIKLANALYRNLEKSKKLDSEGFMDEVERLSSSSSNDRLQYEPSSNDRDEWRKAMMNFSSFFRRQYDADESSNQKNGNNNARIRFDNSQTTNKENDNDQSTNYNGESMVNGSYYKRDFRSRPIRASINAQSMENARQTQPDLTPNDKLKIETTIPPGAGIGGSELYLAFEETSMIYPPRDRYPPALPLVRKFDLETAAIAFGLIKACDVHWVEGKGNDVSDGKKEGGSWRRVTFDEEYITRNFITERLETPQGLEYIGDAVLHLVSKSCIMARFPRRSMMLYNFGANWIVSNDVFGHIFVDAGLEQERAIVGDLLVRENKRIQLERMRSSISKEEFEIRENAPLPLNTLPVIQHLRRADLFEAYVGAIYLTMGFNKASEWCAALFEPWLDRLGRTDNFLARHNLTLAGEARARMEEQIRQQIMKEIQEGQHLKQNSSSNWFSSISQFFQGGKS